MKTYFEFVRLLENHLHSAGRTPSWLAKAIDVDKSTVTKWRNHGTRPGDPILISKIANVLQLTDAETQELSRAADYRIEDSYAKPFPPQTSPTNINPLQDNIEYLRNNPSRGQLTISLPVNIDDFTSKKLDDLVTAICASAEINPEEVFLHNITSGSVKITFSLLLEAARKFVNEVRRKNPRLAAYPITIEKEFQLVKQYGEKENIVILCMAAEPSDTAWLKLGKEHREIFESINRASYGHHFTIQQIWAARARDVLRYLLYYRPAIVHFSGHGIENGALLFEDNQGYQQRVETHTLNELFRGLEGDTHCVVLNSCYSEVQAKQISSYVDCVVGIEGQIENTSAICFASAFYEAIASGRSVRDAHILAQAELLIENLNGSSQVKLLSSAHINPNDVKFVPSKVRSF